MNPSHSVRYRSRTRPARGVKIVGECAIGRRSGSSADDVTRSLGDQICRAHALFVKASAAIPVLVPTGEVLQGQVSASASSKSRGAQVPRTAFRAAWLRLSSMQLPTRVVSVQRWDSVRAFELERHLDLGAITLNATVLDHEIELHHLCHS
jgi:hypothetical protein